MAEDSSSSRGHGQPHFCVMRPTHIRKTMAETPTLPSPQVAVKFVFSDVMGKDFVAKRAKTTEQFSSKNCQAFSSE